MTPAGQTPITAAHHRQNFHDHATAAGAADTAAASQHVNRTAPKHRQSNKQTQTRGQHKTNRHTYDPGHNTAPGQNQKVKN